MKQKQVLQLDSDGYFIGVTTADESPLEQGVFLMPRLTIDGDAPDIPEGQRAKIMNGEWVFEDIVEEDSEELPQLEPIEELRHQRNAFLIATDWWASSDLTMTAEQTAYRQALRDITNTYTSLDDVVWPEEPNV
jgi:hypothetical protein